jgi:hypothetical protein
MFASLLVSGEALGFGLGLKFLVGGAQFFFLRLELFSLALTFSEQ